MEITIKRLGATDLDDFLDLLGVFEDVFEWENFTVPETEHLQKLLNSANFLAFVAISDQKVTGGLTAYVLDRYDTVKPSAYIYDLAVIPDHQRHGIGKTLIAALNGYCEQNGFSEAFVQADSEDIHAVNFYRTTPISHELKAIHFTYSLGKK
jgi:aminoglycoside 3-N-acetyltransferase I